MEHFEEVGWGASGPSMGGALLYLTAQQVPLWEVAHGYCSLPKRELSLQQVNRLPIEHSEMLALGSAGLRRVIVGRSHVSLARGTTAWLRARVKEGPSAMTSRDVLDIATVCSGRRPRS